MYKLYIIYTTIVVVKPVVSQSLEMSKNIFNINFTAETTGLGFEPRQIKDKKWPIIEICEGNENDFFLECLGYKVLLQY